MSRSLRLLVVCVMACLAGSVEYAELADSSVGSRSSYATFRYERSVRGKHAAARTHSRSRWLSRRHYKRGRVPARPRRGHFAAVGSLSLLGSPLVVSGSPTEGEQLRAQQMARLASPEAVDLQAASETAYEGFDAEQAEKTDAEAFPAVLDEPAGGPPQLAEGERIAGFLGAYTAQVELGSQTSAESSVIDSTVPMALEGASGGWTPVDLALRDVGGAFEPANPLVDVRLAKQLSEGALLPSVGLSVAPVGGQSLVMGGSEGKVSGASVFFANSMADSDTIVKPSTFGFLVDTSLRSAKSPDEISFQLGLPAGASLVQANDGSGVVLVVKEGVTIARMPAPLARDAAGRVVPVAVSVAGGVITLTVDRPVGAYRYPVEVDPEFNVGSDTTVTERDWSFTHSGWFSYGQSGGNEMSIGYYGSWDTGEYGALSYETHRHSKIYEMNASTSFSPSSCCNSEGKLYSQDELAISDTLEIHGSGGAETPEVVIDTPTSEWPIKTRLCPKSECTAASGSEDNTVTLRSSIITGSNPAEGQYNGVGEELKAATVGISQPAEIHSTVNFNTSSPEVDNTVNVLYGSGAWMNAHQGAFEYTGHDTGVGVDGINFERYNGAAFENFYSKSFLGTSSCAGVQCAEEQKETLVYESSLASHNLSYYLKEGENRIRVSPHDAIAKTGAGEHGEGEIVLKVDNLPPTKLLLSGLSSKGEVFELGESVGHVTASATDGEAKVGEPVHPSSGVKSIALYVDGRGIGTPHGSCAPGECTASGEWALNGAELGTGLHTLTVVATDNTGNTETKEFALEVYHATPLPMGPGSVNPESGDFALETADVSLSGGVGSLAVTRHYDSLNPHEGIEGPLGPQWTISLGSLASLEVLPDGSVMVVGPDGLTHFTKTSGGGLEAPVGDRSLSLERHTVTLEEEHQGKHEEYLFKDPTKGTTTRFTLPSGAKAWMPTVSEGPIATDTMTDEYTTDEPEPGKKIIEPLLEVAPHPSTTCAYKKLEKGCRALEFNYAPSTTATGEAESEWGDYKGHLTRIYAIAWNPAKGEKGEMATVTVAQYAYDKQGRLRAEWDPRISPALKTIYGYDSEGHVTAITPPGQESTAFTYGTIALDTSPGRLLKVTTAPVSAALWSGEPLKNTEAPVITGVPEVGVRLAVSDGHWNGNPVVFGYQWERCNNSGGECTAIAGATNASYTPTPSDANHVLTVLVTATNGGGSLTASQSVGVSVNERTPNTPLAIVSGPDGNLWFTNPRTNKIGKITPSGAITEYTLPSGSSPRAIVAGPDGNLWFTDFYSDKIGKISTSGVVTEYALPSSSWPAAIVTGPDGNLWFSDLYGGKVGKITTSGVITEYAVPSGSVLSGIATGSDGNLWVTDRSREKIYKLTTSGVVTEYALPAGSQPEGIASSPDGNLWFTDFRSNKIGKITTTGSITEYAVPSGSWPAGITSGPDGNVWFTDYNTSKVGKITKTGTITEYALSGSSFPIGIASGPDGNLWLANYGSGKIGKIMVSGAITEYTLPTGGQQFGIVPGPDGNMWFTNPGTNKIGKVTPSGVITDYALPTGSFPMGIAQGPDGNLWFTDFFSDKIGKISTSGVVTEYALPSGSWPSAIVTGPDGNLWFSDLNSGKVGKITTSGVITEYAVPSGSVLSGIATGSDGNLWVTDRRREKIYKLTTSGVETEYPLPAGSQPEGIASGPDGNLWFTDFRSNKIGKITTTGTITEYAVPSGSWPAGITSGPDGNVWFTEENTSEIGEITTTGAITEYALPSSSAPVGIAAGPDGNLWFGDYGTGKVGNITTSGAITEYALPRIEGESRSPQPGSTIEYNVPLSGAGAPYSMGATELEKWGEKERPVQATAIFPPNEPQTWPATKYKRATIDYMNAEARPVNAATPGGGISTTEYGPYGEVEITLSAANRQQALEEGGNTALNAAWLSTKNFYENEGAHLVSTNGPRHLIKVVKGNTKVPSGSEILARNRVVYYYDENAPATGETYDLVTKTVDEAESATGENLDIRTSTTSYAGQNNLGWKLRTPTSTVTDPEGLKITHTTVYNETTGDVIETRGPASTGTGDTHDAISVYYTAEANSNYPSCGGHIEWVGLPCEALPGKQPETPGLPPIPVKSIAYNVWNEPETVTETFGSTTRTRKTTFDEAGRALTSETTSTADTPVPAITDHYDETTGALVKQSEMIEGKEKMITSAFNKLGQLVFYTDADGITSTFEYEGEGSYKGEKETDARIRHVSDSKGNQTYTYDETSGLMTKLVDSAAGTFTASYDIAGRMTSETYPNNMTATYTRNSVGDATGIEYKKNAHCATSCPEEWFKDAIVASVHGEELKQTSSLAEEPKYTYDAAGRLTEVQEIPAGKGCVTRLYAYDIESNRSSLTSREPGSEGKCATEGGSSETHTYDQANRLIDAGVTYDTFGNTTKVPAADAGGAEISSSFYADNQVASQTQSGETSSYYMDPAGRVRETVSSGKTASVTTNHYAGAGSAVSWVSEPEEKWTRNIPGIDGTLSATQTNNGTVTLLLHDLQGNVIAEAALSETETKLSKSYNSTEFGVPQPGTTPPKYSWLGATGLASESSTGTIVKDGITYIPQTGRPLQTESLTVPIPQNAAKEYTDTLEPWVAEADAAAAAQQVANAEQARAAIEQANQPPGVLPSGNPGWWCGGEYGACEGEGGEGGGSGCSGMNACAASVNPHHHGGVVGYHERGNGYAGCSVWASYGTQYGLSGISGEIEIFGHWKCKEAVTMFEIQIALLVYYEGSWVEIGPPAEPLSYFDISGSYQEDRYKHRFGCGPEHLTYDAWVFGRQYDDSYKARWWSWGREAEYRGSCHGGVALPEAP